VTTLRERLGRVGVWSGPVVRRPAAEAREVVAEIEELGFRALWYPEGPEAFSQGGILLAASRKLVLCTGIAHIYARDPQAMANGAAALSEAYPGRFVLGLGVSHRPAVEGRGHDYARPVPAMRAYLDAMDATRIAAPSPAEPTPRVLAALGPLMLRLAAERTQGVHPYFVPPEHTAYAREILGPEPLICVEQTIVLETDEAEGRRLAREFVTPYLGLENYRNNLIRIGIPEDEVDSDAVADRVVARGSVEDAAARVRAHLEAGADHVCVQVAPSREPGLAQLRELAPALLEL
jgi:probable F420-dependent oxidoreductase